MHDCTGSFYALRHRRTFYFEKGGDKGMRYMERGGIWRQFFEGKEMFMKYLRINIQSLLTRMTVFFGLVVLAGCVALRRNLLAWTNQSARLGKLWA
ncbi:hypothetical protein TcarDRAFT_2210 [Thermosinus carboxydivorans Nor1]|uniref:Uncharacterized protein n=1 Tax=Thermosinus carboxydivorans Nor1 TaxID=401526 RepID=A1HMP6_9FIRM|nr:hypothetical protein TcarDRAFT_2210 [Thermosinus carboxydivorans Nor1]